MQYRNITPFRQKNINFVTNKGKKHKIDLHAGGFQTESIHGRCRNRKLHQGIPKTRRIPAGREPKYKFSGERNRGDTVPEGKRRSIIDKRRPRVQGIRIADTILVFSNFRDVRAKGKLTSGKPVRICADSVAAAYLLPKPLTMITGSNPDIVFDLTQPGQGSRYWRLPTARRFRERISERLRMPTWKSQHRQVRRPLTSRVKASS